MSVGPSTSPRDEGQPETRKLMYVFNGEPVRTGSELVTAMRQDWRRATKLLKRFSDPALTAWLEARPDGEMLMQALRLDRNAAARFLRLQAEFDPARELEFRGRVISDATILTAAQNASQAEDAESREVAEDIAWLEKIRDQRILHAIAAAVDDSSVRARLRAEVRLQNWTRQVQTVLDECVAAWAYVVTGVGVQSAPLIAALVRGEGPESEPDADQQRAQHLPPRGLTPLQSVMRERNFAEGVFATSDAGEFCARQLSLWTAHHRLETKLRAHILEHQDSPQDAAIFRSLLDDLPEVSDYNFEILSAVENVARRSGSQLGLIFTAAFREGVAANEFANAIAAANRLEALIGMGTTEPQAESSYVLSARADVSPEARSQRFRGWSSSLSEGLTQADLPELGTVIATRMVIEELLGVGAIPKARTNAVSD